RRIEGREVERPSDGDDARLKADGVLSFESARLLEPRDVTGGDLIQRGVSLTAQGAVVEAPVARTRERPYGRGRLLLPRAARREDEKDCYAPVHHEGTSLFFVARPGGGTGRHAVLRGQCREASRFESEPGHNRSVARVAGAM